MIREIKIHIYVRATFTIRWDLELICLEKYFAWVNVSYMKKSFKIRLMRNLEPLDSQTQKISWRDDDGVINKRNICETWLHNNWFHIWWTFTKQKRFSFSISVEQTQAVHKNKALWLKLSTICWESFCLSFWDFLGCTFQAVAQ